MILILKTKSVLIRLIKMEAYDDRCDGTIEEDFWKKINQEYHTEKAELIEQLNRINEADVKFYDTCEKLLAFAKDSYNMFMNGTVEDKRFITQTVLSNATYYDGKLDVELHPAFDTLFRLSKEHELKKSTIEPSESTDFTNKKTLPKKCFNNGGVDVARFELFITRFIKHLFTPNTAKICSMIEKLGLVV